MEEKLEGYLDGVEETLMDRPLTRNIEQDEHLGEGQTTRTKRKGRKRDWEG